MQTLAGLALDSKRQVLLQKRPSELVAIQYLLNTFLCLNVCQFMVLILLAHLDRQKKAAAAVISTHGYSDGLLPEDKHQPNGTNDADYTEGAVSIHLSLLPREGQLSACPEPYSKAKQHIRGKLYAGLSLTLVVFSWALFLVTAWMRLRPR